MRLRLAIAAALLLAACGRAAEPADGLTAEQDDQLNAAAAELDANVPAANSPSQQGKQP